MRAIRVSPYTVPVLLTVVLLAALLASANAGATAPRQAIPNSPDAPAQFFMNYQGRLLNPTTGEPLPDRAYEIAFILYDKPTDGTDLWSEVDSVSVVNGVFTTILGDGTPLPSGLFAEHFITTGQTLWLGIQVTGDPEMEPRQQLTFVGYAMYAANASNADFLDNRDAGSFANASHTHNGADINAGIVADARIAATLTRDNEVMAIVLANDGAGSGLDADRLDGHDSAEFAPANHSHAALPVAHAFIQANGTKTSGTPNVASQWTAANRYEISIAGHSYFYSSYTTLVTLVQGCPAGATPRVSSVSGRLLVYVINSAGSSIQCDFQFVTFQQ